MCEIFTFIQIYCVGLYYTFMATYHVIVIWWVPVNGKIQIYLLRNLGTGANPLAVVLSATVVSSRLVLAIYNRYATSGVCMTYKFIKLLPPTMIM